MEFYNVMVFTMFGLVFMVDAMFLRFLGHHMRLYPMVANHPSSHVMYLIYCSSLAPNWSAFENFEGFCDIL